VDSSSPGVVNASPVPDVIAKIFTASEELAEVVLEPHQEASYMPTFPAKFFLYCDFPAKEGGESAVTDMRA
ncbi:unnamed protein product, partial [Amoebophrya sp. A25]